jgi:hypothetical protein
MAKKPEDRYQRGREMANDLRNLRNLQPAAAVQAPFDYEKTVLLAPGSQPARPGREATLAYPAAAQAPSRPAPSAKMNDSGSRRDADTRPPNLEAEQHARSHAENETHRNIDEEARLWRESVARKREALARQEEGADRRNALDLLKSKASARPPGDAAQLDQSMRAALQYFGEVARGLNSVNPWSERPYDFVFLGRLPAVRLSNALVDLLSDRIDGKERAFFLFFEFRAQPATPARASLRGEDIARFSEFLKRKNTPFETKTEEMSKTGQVTRSGFTVTAPLPCEVNIRADYAKWSVEIELVNVRRPGRTRLQIEPQALAQAVDDLARYLLGVDDDFEKLPDRR